MNNLTEQKKSIMREYYPQHFNKLSDEKKLDLYQRTAELAKQELGLTRHYDVYVNNNKDVTYGAFYQPSTDRDKSSLTLGLGVTATNDTMYLFNTIFHEMKHAEQDEIRNGFKKDASLKRELLCQANIGKRADVNIKGFNYNGTQIKDYVRNVSTYISIPSESRMTQFDRTSEIQLFYRAQPMEREAYEYGMENYKQMAQQMYEDGVSTYVEYQGKLDYANYQVDSVYHQLKLLYPDSIDIKDDIDNTILNLYNHMNGGNSAYFVSSEQLEWAAKWSMAQSAAKQTDSKYEPNFVDPRTIIDQKNMMRQKALAMEQKVKQNFFKGDKGLAEAAKRGINGTLVDGLSEKEYNDKRMEAFRERRTHPSRINHFDVGLMGAIKKFFYTRAIEKEHFQDKSIPDLVRCFNPNNYNRLKEPVKEALIAECIDSMATNLGLVNQYKPEFIRIVNADYKPNGNYLQDNKIQVDLSANPLDIVRSISYNMHKAFQKELLLDMVKEDYNGQRMLYEIQRQPSKMVMSRYRFEQGDMYITEPDKKKNFLLTHEDVSKNLYGMHKLQPVERDACKFSDKYAKILLDSMTSKPCTIDDKLSKAIFDFNETSYENIAKDYIKDKNLDYMEKEINVIMVNMYTEAAGKPGPFTVHDKDLEETFRIAQLDSVTYRTENKVFIPKETIEHQEEILDRYTNWMQQNEPQNIVTSESEQIQSATIDDFANEQFSKEDFENCISGVQDDIETNIDNEINEWNQYENQEVDEDDISL